MTRRRALLGLLALVLVGLTVGGAALPASAHAQLETTTPVDGSVVATAPTSVKLTFSESVTVNLGAIRVFDTAGNRVDLGNSRHAGADDAVAVGLKAKLRNGTYVVSWRVVSADAHPVHGGFLFSIGTKSAVKAGLADAAIDSSGDQGWQVFDAGLRIVAYVGTLLAAGGAVLLALIGAEDDRRRLAPAFTVGAGAAAVAVLLQLPVQATLATGLGATAITKTGVLSQVLGDGVGTSTLALVVGLGLVAVALRRPAGTAWPMTLLGAVLATGSFALAGHTRVTSPAWLLTTVDLAHLFAGAVWFGGLVVLGVVLKRFHATRDPAGAASAVARFSTIASVALAVVAAAGLTMGWYEVRAARALTDTTYGRLLLLKVGVVAVIATMGAYNHYQLVPTVAGADHDDARWGVLRRTVKLEAIGLVAVLAITGVLVNVTPARTAAGIGSVSSITAPLGKGSINITVDPNRAGTNSIHVYLLDADGRQDDRATALALEFSQPAKDIGPISRPTFKAGPGHWQYDGDALSITGQWQITAVATISEFDEERAVMTLRVNP